MAVGIQYLQRRADIVPRVSSSSTACDWSTGRKRSHSNSNQLKISNITVVTSLWNPCFYISCKARSSSLYQRTKMLMKKIRRRTKNRRKQSCRTCQMPHHASPYCEALSCDPLFPLVSPQLQFPCHARQCDIQLPRWNFTIDVCCHV